MYTRGRLKNIASKLYCLLYSRRKARNILQKKNTKVSITLAEFSVKHKIKIEKFSINIWFVLLCNIFKFNSQLIKQKSHGLSVFVKIWNHLYIIAMYNFSCIIILRSVFYIRSISVCIKQLEKWITITNLSKKLGLF